MKISELSIKRPVYVIVLFLLLTVLGILSYNSLSAEQMPKFSPPILNIQIIYPGASPSEVENSLTRKVEDALSSMEGIDQLQSYSFEGMSMMIVSFVYGTDIDKSVTDAQNLLNAKRAELPREILSPTISKISVDEKPILILFATSNLEPTDFYDLIDKRIIPEFSRVRGVAKITLVGGMQREIQINFNREKLKTFGLTPLMIQNAIRAANLDFPTGYLHSDESQTAIRLSGKLKNIEELRRLVINTSPTGAQIRLGDIADVSDAVKDPVKLGRVNGQDAILINLQKQSDANAIEVSDQVLKTITQLQETYSAEDLKITEAQNTTTFTNQSINSVFTDLILAILLVTLVILLFLNNIRNALIVMVVVPVSLVSTFIGMQLFNFTLNLMSLLALSLVIGVLVDDAIVVIENVYRHIEMGKNRVKATFDAMNEIGFTVISITIAIVMVFLPVIFTETLVSDILRQFCAVIVISILFSLLAALTLVPLLTSRFGNIQEIKGKNIFQKMLRSFNKGISQFSNWISEILKWGLGHKRWVALIVIVITIAVMALFPLGFINFEFQPYIDRGEFIVQLEMPKSISMEESNALVQRAENWFMSRSEVEDIVTMVGVTSDNTQSTKGTPYLAELNVKIKKLSEGTETYITRIRKPLSDYLVDAKVNIFSVSLTGTASKAAVEYVISGSNADSVMIFAEKALQILGSIPGVMQQELSVENATPEITVTINRDKMSLLGLSLDNVGMVMQMNFQGNDQLKYSEGNYEYDINIRSDKAYREKSENVSNLTFVNNRGESVRLSQFATISLGTGPNRLERFDRNSSVTLRSQVFGVPAGAVSKVFMSEINKMNKPQGLRIETVGDMKKMSDSMSVLTTALMLSLMLIYLSMVVLYNNWTDPFVVMFSIPFSIVGAILALALTNTAMSIYAMLGLVMLVGLVAKNAILLVDFANDARAQGKDIDEALIHAVRIRTRPILMTALSTVIGMLPVALSKGSGAELRNGMAWVIIGGMTMSTLLTLVVVPVVYKVLHPARKAKREKIDIEKLMYAKE
ncbi:MAG TPA: efflux RND transporter permease subunit [Ignavibacteriaceae bacterium]|jgi:HAE1 family hydrophobic/amphiphilic exporter-1|nr:MAG: acriflavin resistance protein [Ignavibacteriales bacterium UTCHB2]HQF41595.1 efflux RND transporter permease subunit [Ignavibacteriaceae bacterium]HQI40743.1 efflux RND transporter permease subunit [Ignavibacteriaceae bacterium]